MRRVVLTTILYLGPYAVLPVVALVLAIFMLWLIAIDRQPVVALVAAPIVLPATPAAIALAMGLLFLPRRNDEHNAVDEHAAPGLWAIWKELDGGSYRSRTLMIDPQLNASISEQRRHFGIFGRHVTMTVGLALLIIVDERAVRAVIAHEVAHARLQHASGGTNLADFIAAAENVLHFADPASTITGRIAYVILHALLEWLGKEHRALSRQNELSADREAAAHVDRYEIARSLVLIEAGRARLDDLVFAQLESELLGAIAVPMAPFQRIAKQLNAIRAPAELAAAAAARVISEPEPDSTHPHFRELLANLGFSDVPQIDAVQASAIDKLLSREAASELPARFDNEWRRYAKARVDVDQ
jgi:Zn-dependent protease with chaperone function